MNDQYLRMTTRSVFAPQEKNPKGEIHEDVGFFSYDKFAQKFVLRSFYVEGFVNTYHLNYLSEVGDTLIFEAVDIENGPEGTRARLTFIKLDDGRLEQKFFVAFPGQDLSCFSTNILNKKE